MAIKKREAKAEAVEKLVKELVDKPYGGEANN